MLSCCKIRATLTDGGEMETWRVQGLYSGLERDGMI